MRIKMLTIVLAESELELIPNEIISHPAVLSYTKLRNKKARSLILDSNFHYSALKKLKEGERRGRPDIVHIFLLNSLESILNKKGKLKIIIHTRNDQAIFINSKTRIMRNYNRFIGLLEQLFEKKKIVTEEKILLELRENFPLEKIIEKEEYDSVITFSENGKFVNLPDYLTDLRNKKIENILCIVGGFPSGDFHFDVKKYSDDVISIFEERLNAWSVSNELLAFFNNIF
jgi:rRNA small subunit pseudouridine methyltransferase Nep1